MEVRLGRLQLIGQGVLWRMAGGGSQREIEAGLDICQAAFDDAASRPHLEEEVSQLRMAFVRAGLALRPPALDACTDSEAVICLQQDATECSNAAEEKPAQSPETESLRENPPMQAAAADLSKVIDAECTVEQAEKCLQPAVATDSQLHDESETEPIEAAQVYAVGENDGRPGYPVPLQPRSAHFLRRAPNRISPELEQEIVGHFQSGWSKSRIARVYRLNRRTVIRAVEEAGVHKNQLVQVSPFLPGQSVRIHSHDGIENQA